MRTLTTVLTVIAALSIASNSSVAQELPRTQLKIVGLQSHLNSFKSGEKPFWEEVIPRESGGQVTAVVTAQDLNGLKGPEILRLMKLGVIDFASGVLSYMSGDNAEFDGVDLTGLSPDMETTREMIKVYKPTLERIMQDEYGAKLLMMFPSPPQVFWCQKPITEVGDLKGLKVRVFNTSMADFVSGLGATPVTMPFGEVTASLERGVIDCAITGTLSGNTNKMFEVTSHLYPLYAGWSLHFTAASQQTWDSLDPQVQEFLLAHLNEFEDQLWATVSEEIEDGIRCSIGDDPCKFGYKGDMTLVPVSDEAKDLARKVVAENVLPSWASRCGAECVEEWNSTIGKLMNVEASIN